MHKPERYNSDRAASALEAVMAYFRDTRHGEDIEPSLDMGADIVTEVIGDLISDLFHLADRNGVGFYDLFDTARMHFVAEKQEDGWAALPEEAALKLADLAASKQVQEDNPHGSDWQLILARDQGPQVHELDRYHARFESTKGWWADYFYVGGSWSVGAN